MIFSDQVRNVAEDFLTKTLSKWPKTVEVLLSHPQWPTWCEKAAAKLSELEAQALLEGNPFNALAEIQVWAAHYADHSLTKAQDAYFKQVQNELPETK